MELYYSVRLKAIRMEEVRKDIKILTNFKKRNPKMFELSESQASLDAYIEELKELEGRK